MKVKKQVFVVDFLRTCVEHRDADGWPNSPWTCGCVACLSIKHAGPELLESAELALRDIRRTGYPETSQTVIALRRATGAARGSNGAPQ